MTYSVEPPPTAAVFSKPGGVESNPPPIPSADLARRAVLQLKSWGDLNQGQVRRILPTWRHFDHLTAQQMLVIVEQFPPGEDDEPAVFQGGGWISGSSQDGGE